MALYTNRQDIKPMLFGITFMMMIMLGWFTARTLQRIDGWQLTVFNGYQHSCTSFDSFRVILLIAFFGGLTFITLVMTFTSNLTSFALFVVLSSGPTLLTLFVVLLIGFVFFAFSILQTTFFATRLMAVFFDSVFAELGNCFSFLASRASFRYDFGRHLLLLIRSKCSGLVAPPVGVSSSLYCTAILL